MQHCCLVISNKQCCMYSIQACIQCCMYVTASEKAPLGIKQTLLCIQMCYVVCCLCTKCIVIVSVCCCVV